MSAYNTSKLELDSCTLQHNKASEDGGALQIRDKAQVNMDTLTIVTSTLCHRCCKAAGSRDQIVCIATALTVHCCMW
jgi:hypothetical protein